MAPLRLTLALVGSSLLIAAGYGLGHRAGQADEAAKAWRADALASRAAIERIERSVAAGARVSADLAVRASEVRTRTTTLVREVPIHVSTSVDARFAVPVGLVRVHDAAAAGVDLSAVPDPAGRADESASDIVASDLATAIVENYGTCRGELARLAAWQDWASAQLEAN